MFSTVIEILKRINKQLCLSHKLLPTVIDQLNLVDSLNEALDNNEPLELNFKQMKKIYFITKDGCTGVLYKSSKEGNLSEGRLNSKGMGVKPSQYWNRFGKNMNEKSNADIARIMYIELK